MQKQDRMMEKNHKSDKNCINDYGHHPKFVKKPINKFKAVEKSGQCGEKDVVHLLCKQKEDDKFSCCHHHCPH